MALRFFTRPLPGTHPFYGVAPTGAVALVFLPAAATLAWLLNVQRELDLASDSGARTTLAVWWGVVVPGCIALTVALPVLVFRATRACTPAGRALSGMAGFIPAVFGSFMAAFLVRSVSPGHAAWGSMWIALALGGFGAIPPWLLLEVWLASWAEFGGGRAPRR